MVRRCSVSGCCNRMTRCTNVTFHRLPFSDQQRLKLWLLVLGTDINTPINDPKLKEVRICSAHFADTDFRDKQDPKKIFLKSTAVPHVGPAISTGAEAAVSQNPAEPFPTEGDFSSKVSTSDHHSSPTKEKHHATSLHTDRPIGHRLLITTPLQAKLQPRTRPSSSGTYLASPPTCGPSTDDNSNAGKVSDIVLHQQPNRQSVDEKSSSAQPIILNSQPVSSNRQKDVVGLCAVPTCCNRIEEWSTVTFHPLPFDDPETLKLWLVVLQQDVDTPIETLRTADLRVCGDHFSDDDYDRANKREIKTPAKYPALKKNKGWRSSLKKTSVPVAVPRCQQQCTEEGGAGMETTVQQTASVIGRPPTDLTQWKAPVKKTSSVEDKRPSSFALQEVTVNLDCLLQLFRTCGQCRGDCVTDIEGDRRCFTVVQRCQNCNNLNTWDSHPGKIYETVIQSGNSIQAKELASLSCEVREEDQAWTGALRIVVKEEVTDNETNTAPSQEQDLEGGGEEGSNEAAKESEMIGLEMSRDCKEEVEKDDEEEAAMEEKEGEEREEGDWDENLNIYEDGDDEKEEEEEDDDNEEEEWEMEEEEEDNDESEMEEGEGEEEEEVQRKKRGVNKEMNFGKHGRVPTKLLGQRVLCPECGVLYSSQTHRCDPRKKFQCPHCDRFFVSESCLDAHRSTTCKGKANYLCKFCLQPYHTMQEKRIHQKGHPRGQRYLCSECPQTFLREVQRNDHLKKQHPKKFECPTCHKVFPTHNLLGRHVLSHSINKPFRCQVCSRLFAQASQLKCHMRVHTGERPYQCRLCPKSFNHNVSLKNHIRRYHQGEIQHSPGSDNE